MMRIYSDDDADVSLIQQKRVSILGYGSQGCAQALNLRDSRVQVRIGLRPGNSWRKAHADGFQVVTVSEACRWGDLIALLVPDTTLPSLYEREVLPYLTAGKSLLFAHGFNIRFGRVLAPPDVDAVLVAPKAPGHQVRELFAAGGGAPALVAVHQDTTGTARPLALSYAKAIGATRAAAIETSFAEETETDLFGEQAVLCGGVSALIKAAYEVLVEAGFQAEVAYFECLHELKLIVDLIYRGGLSFMRHSVSNTAEFGDYAAGPRIITEAVRNEMRLLLREIRNGDFAQRWIEESRGGSSWLIKQRREERNQPIETVGARLRSLMPFIKPVNPGSLEQQR